MRRPPAGSIPDAPGSYQFKDQHGRVIYVGKAKSLRSRLSNYFGPPATLLPRTRQMVAAAETVEWIEVRNEVEALFLEYNLIKEHRPRFNIRYKDAEGKIRYAHSLNNTAVAAPRILVSLVENYQQADGSIKIPDVLIPYFGKDKIG